MKNSFILFFLIFSILSCNQKSKKQALLRQKQTQDSIQIIEKERIAAELNRNQLRLDSIIREEEKIAISDINFGITETEFKEKKSFFLKECNTNYRYSLGEFGFSDIYGSFYDNKLYEIILKGDKVRYDEYDRIMSDQYKFLMSILKQKYNEPVDETGLPKWNDVNKGNMENCASWKFGKKRIYVYLRCEGVEYSLYLIIDRIDISLKASEERERKEAESNIKGVDLL